MACTTAKLKKWLTSGKPSSSRTRAIEEEDPPHEATSKVQAVLAGKAYMERHHRVAGIAYKNI